MAKQKYRYIDLDYSSPDALKAEVIPYDGSNSIKAKIDAHDAAVAPHTGVVKTAGDQSVSGIKTFTQFPITPSSPPSVDYEIANKKYVDDNTGGNINHGDLQGLSNNDHLQYPLVSGSISQFSNSDHDQLDGLTDDDHLQYLTVARHDILGHSPVASSILHNGLSGIGVDDHHNKVHAINGVDHTGDLAYLQLDSLVDTSGGGSANMISGAQHVHTDADGSSKVSHSNLINLTTDDHHDKFDATDHDARDHSAVAGTVALAELGSRTHAELTSISANQHHNQAHALSGADHTGDLLFTQLDSIVNTSGLGSSAKLIASNHGHTDADGSNKISHDNLTGLSSSQHHTIFTPTQHDARDHSAVAGTISLVELGSRLHSQLESIGANDHHASFTVTDHDARDHSAVAGTISLVELGSRLHSQLASIGVNDHHAQVHTLQSHSGDLAYTQLDSIVDTSGQGGSAQISRANHQHTDADGSTKVNHANLSGISASQHHSEFTTTQHDARDHTAVAGTISLSELGSRAHSQLTSIGTNDHHVKFTTTEHASVNHAGLPGVPGTALFVPMNTNVLITNQGPAWPTPTTYVIDVSAYVPVGTREILITCGQATVYPMSGILRVFGHTNGNINTGVSYAWHEQNGTSSIAIIGSAWVALDSNRRFGLSIYNSTTLTSYTIALRGYMPA